MNLEGGLKKPTFNRILIIIINLLFALMFATLLGVLAGKPSNVAEVPRYVLIIVGIVFVPLIFIIIGIAILQKSTIGSKICIMIGIFSLTISSIIYTIMSEPEVEDKIQAAGYALYLFTGIIWFIFTGWTCNFCAASKQGKSANIKLGKSAKINPGT
jgi:hypothetical protein